MIIFCLSITQLATQRFVVGAGIENKTFNYFYKLLFEAYKQYF